MYVILYVSKDVDQASDMLDIWVKAGVSGVTILESAGMSQISKGIKDDVGLMFSLSSLMRAREIHHRTLFSAIKDDETLHKVVKAATDYVGDWSSPDVGVLLVWPLIEAYGLEKKLR